MYIRRKVFSKNDSDSVSNKDTKPTKPVNSPYKNRHIGAYVAGSLGTAAAPLIYMKSVGNDISKINKEISDRIQETVEAAKKGDSKATERIIKLNNDPTGFKQKINKIANKSLRLRKAKIKGVAKASVPLALSLYGAHGLSNTKKENEKKNERYKKQLREWRKNNKKEDK